MNVNSHGRADVALRIYRHLRRLRPGSDEYETAEKALSLVFNEHRCEDSFLLRNVLRDARRVRERSAARAPERAQYVQVDDVRGTGNCPEQNLAAAEMLAQVERVVASELPSDALLCLPGLLREETIEESSAVTGLLPRRVKYLRDRIRTSVANALALAS
ncbi:MAG TPA: hypothetical protein VGL81_31595 [Polyangiaceae bacterium]|jgi:hypothetical protein